MKVYKQKPKQLSWYSQPIVIVMSIIIFFPIGIFFIYKNQWILKEIKGQVVILVALMALIIGGTFIFGDDEAPKLEVKDEISYKVNSKVTEDEFKEDVFVEVTDNKTDMKNADIKVNGYNKVDFSKKGTTSVYITALDQKGNAVSEEVKVKITN